MTSTKGLLIVFEGIDGSGKTTQAKMLAEKINGVYMAFPNRSSAIGQVIDKVLRKEIQMDSTALQLLFAADKHDASKTIKEHIDNGRTVILDRYVLSAYAYYCKMTPESLLNDSLFLTCIHAGAQRPDITFMMNIDPAKRHLRANDMEGGELYENIDKLRNVVDMYNCIVSRIKEGALNDNTVFIADIDASKSIEDVRANIDAVYTDYVKKVNSSLCNSNEFPKE
jgi:dTMP kinase